jgi:hypothetical protein
VIGRKKDKPVVWRFDKQAALHQLEILSSSYSTMAEKGDALVRLKAMLDG